MGKTTIKENSLKPYVTNVTVHCNDLVQKGSQNQQTVLYKSSTSVASVAVQYNIKYNHCKFGY